MYILNKRSVTLIFFFFFDRYNLEKLRVRLLKLATTDIG